MLHFIRLCREEGGADGNGGDGSPASTTVKVDAGAPPAPAYTPPSLDMATALPPEYREKPAFKGKDFVTLVKEHDNLQTLLGQRPAGIPGENATDEEWGKFIGTIRPKDLKEYVFPETEHSKANPRSPEFEQAVREIMAEVGAPKKLFGKGVEKIEAILSQGMKGHVEAKAKADAARNIEFDGLLDKTYGKDKGVVTERAKALMVESVAPELKEQVTKVLKDMPNDTLFAITAVLNGIHAKYIAEDNPPGGGNPPAGGDPSALKAEAEALMRSDAYKDWRNPGHESAKQKVQELFKRISPGKK